jgi:hypothetical protein
MPDLHTARLRLVPGTVELFDADPDEPERLAALRGVTDLSDWPPGGSDYDPTPSRSSGAHTRPDNPASMAVLAGNGFVESGAGPARPPAVRAAADLGNDRAVALKRAPAGQSSAAMSCSPIQRP